jgi:beta-phosphoglucomutase-like phosphatase (HAD superfamily)
MTYIFDFDGTLVDSMPLFGKVMVRILDENNVNYPDDVLNIITPLGYKGAGEYARSIGYPHSTSEFVSKVLEYAGYEYLNVVPLKAHVGEKLTQLKNEGHSLSILTASPHDIVDGCLKRNGIYELFDKVWSCEDFNRTKAEVEIYHEAAQMLGKKAVECTFVDDNLGAVSTAKKSGMTVIGVYDETSEATKDDIKSIADRYINDFSEL